MLWSRKGPDRHAHWQADYEEDLEDMDLSAEEQAAQLAVQVFRTVTVTGQPEPELAVSAHNKCARDCPTGGSRMDSPRSSSNQVHQESAKRVLVPASV